MKLLDRLRAYMRTKHYSRRTEDAYRGWVKRFVRANGMRHPRELGAEDLVRFISRLAVEGNVSASTQTQALSALLFLYREVLGQDPGRLGEVVPARKPRRLPVVLTRAEVRAVLGQLSGVPRLAASLIYGSGLRLLECLQLRVKDMDFDQRQLIVRGGKGDRDRVTVLPGAFVAALQHHLERVRATHCRTCVAGPAGWTCRRHWIASTRPRRRNGGGSGSFRPRARMW